MSINLRDVVLNLQTQLAARLQASRSVIGHRSAAMDLARYGKVLEE